MIGSSAITFCSWVILFQFLDEFLSKFGGKCGMTPEEVVIVGVGLGKDPGSILFEIIFHLTEGIGLDTDSRVVSTDSQKSPYSCCQLIFTNHEWSQKENTVVSLISSSMFLNKELLYSN